MLQEIYLVVSFIILFVISIVIIRYFAYKQISWLVYTFSVLGTFLACSALVLLPLDVNSTMTHQVALLWQTMYWSCFVMSWFGLSFIDKFDISGHFTFIEKCRFAIKQNLIIYLCGGIILLILTGFLLIFRGVNVIKLETVAMIFSQTIGIIIIIILMGYGLVEIPLFICLKFKRQKYLDYLYSRISSINGEFDDLFQQWSDVEVQVSKLNDFSFANAANANDTFLAMTSIINKNVILPGEFTFVRPSPSPSASDRTDVTVPIDFTIKDFVKVHHKVKVLKRKIILCMGYHSDLIALATIIAAHPLPSKISNIFKLIGILICMSFSITLFFCETTLWSSVPMCPFYYIDMPKSWISTMIFFALMWISCLRLLGSLNIFGIYYISSRYKTNETSIIILVNALVTISFPLSNNFLSLIQPHSTEFETIFRSMNEFPLVSIWVPLFTIIIVSVATLFLKYKEYFRPDEIAVQDGQVLFKLVTRPRTLDT
jgi:hypothetical protein